MNESLVAMAKAKAELYHLDPVLVCAVVEQESGWDCWAIRFEPGFERRYIHPAIPEAPTTEELTKAMSFGLMQVMGEVARELGFQHKFLTMLCEPDIGLTVGCNKLAKCLVTEGGDETKALLRWNGGSNPNYAAEVLARKEHYQ